MFTYSYLSQVEQIQAEYKVRALQFHPDKNPDDAEAESRFQELQVRQTVMTLDMFLKWYCGLIHKGKLNDYWKPGYK